MPRKARKVSKSGIYHIMLRGINQQRIFEDQEDSIKFIDVLKDYKAVSGYKVYAYCLMGNHVHLLLGEGKEPLEKIFRRIGGKYVYWYNWKYNRIGHLFQDRFKSEPVENDEYFLTVLRYIHQNPIKAGLCKKLEEYKFSSYNEYVREAYLVDTDLALGMMSKEGFIEFNSEENQDKCLDLEDKHRLTDNEARRIIVKVSKCKTSADFQKLDMDMRNKCIHKLKEKGLSIRQISRLTGVSKGVVERV